MSGLPKNLRQAEGQPDLEILSDLRAWPLDWPLDEQGTLSCV
jgi:hypothetical protein